MSLRLRLFPILALAAVALAGCGKQGPLDRPAPLFGGPAGAPAQTAADGPSPVSTVDRRDRDTATDLPPIPQPPPQAPGR